MSHIGRKYLHKRKNICNFAPKTDTMRQEQVIGALLITITIIVIAVAIAIVPKFVETENNNAFTVDSVLIDSLERQWKAAQPQYRKKHWSKYKKDTVPLQMQFFDPNTADSITLLQVGLQPWQAKGILKYRAKGGRYRKPEDMKKWEGISDSLYRTLEPWIRIDTIALDSIKRIGDSLRIQTDSLKKLKRDSLNKTRRDSLALAKYGYIPHEKRDTILELNRADTLDLQFIRGIGPSLAKKIVKRRKELGGFVSVTQLAEIDAIAAAFSKDSPTQDSDFQKQLTLDSLYKHFTVDTTLIRYINVNRASVSQLTKHPYISYEQAKQIEDLHHRRTIKSEEDLVKYGIFSRVELEKLRPYLRYDK